MHQNDLDAVVQPLHYNIDQEADEVHKQDAEDKAHNQDVGVVACQRQHEPDILRDKEEASDRHVDCGDKGTVDDESFHDDMVEEVHLVVAAAFCALDNVHMDKVGKVANVVVVHNVGEDNQLQLLLHLPDSHDLHAAHHQRDVNVVLGARAASDPSANEKHIKRANVG